MKTAAAKTKGVCLSPDLPPGHYRIETEVSIQKSGEWIFDDLGAFTAKHDVPAVGWSPGAVLGTGAFFLVVAFLVGWTVREWLES